jgi:hypothetical protein
MALSFSSQVYTVAFLESPNKFTVLQVKQTTSGSNAFEIKDLSPPVSGFYKGYKYSGFSSGSPGVYTLNLDSYNSSSTCSSAIYTINTDGNALPKSATLSFPSGSNCVFPKANKTPPFPSFSRLPTVP